MNIIEIQITLDLELLQLFSGQSVLYNLKFILYELEIANFSWSSIVIILEGMNCIIFCLTDAIQLRDFFPPTIVLVMLCLISNVMLFLRLLRVYESHSS